MGLFDFLKKDKDVILGIEFPKYKGTKLFAVGAGLTNREKYQRKDYYYKLDYEKLNSYIALISSYGFVKNSNVKYIKQNAYIIIEEIDHRLHIAFHVNK